MDMIQLFMGLAVLGGASLVSALFIYNSISAKYPILEFRILDRGSIRSERYRLYGNLIVWNNLIGILFNQFKMFGDIRDFEFFANGKKKIYLATLRNNFLFAIKQKKETKGKDGSTIKLTDIPPVFEIDPESKAIFSGLFMPKLSFSDNVPVPFRLTNVNEELVEQEIINGQSIGGKLIDAILNNKQHNDSSNPLTTIIVGMLPLVVIVGLFLIGIYLTISWTSTTNAEILKHLVELEKLLAK